MWGRYHVGHVRAGAPQQWPVTLCSPRMHPDRFPSIPQKGRGKFPFCGAEEWAGRGVTSRGPPQGQRPGRQSQAPGILGCLALLLLWPQIEIKRLTQAQKPAGKESMKLGTEQWAAGRAGSTGLLGSVTTDPDLLDLQICISNRCLGVPGAWGAWLVASEPQFHL